DIVAVAAGQRVVAGAADDHVVTVAAVGDELHAGEPGRGDDVVAAETVDDDAIHVRIEVLDRHQLGETRHRDHAIVVGHRDHVVAGRAVDDDRVLRAVGRAVHSQIEIDVLNAGPAQVVDIDGVDTAQRGEIDVLHAVDVHRHRGNIARHTHALAVRRDV